MWSIDHLFNIKVWRVYVTTNILNKIPHEGREAVVVLGRARLVLLFCQK